MRNVNGIFGFALAIACALPLGCGDDSATGGGGGDGGSSTTDKGGGPGDGGNGAGGQPQGGQPQGGGFEQGGNGGSGASVSDGGSGGSISDGGNGGSGGSISDGGNGGSGGSVSDGGAGGEGGEGGEGGGEPGCVEITLDAFVRDDPGVYLAPLATALGGAAIDVAGLEFYDDATGNIMIGAGANNNYATCEQCLLVYEDVPASGPPARFYYPTGGSIAITPQSLPDTDGLVATLTDVTLVEVTIAPGPSFMSTPVPGGQCLHIATASVNLPAPPPEWECGAEFYAASDGCDCECGAPDPDCMDTAQLVFGCGLTHAATDTNRSQCSAGVCVQPATWTCTAAQFNDGTACNCNCGGSDIDCENLEPVTGCQAAEFCSTSSTCVAATGGEACASATPLTPGVTYGTLAGKAATLDPTGTGCTGFEQSGRDVVYSVSLTAGQRLEVLARQADGDVGVYLLSNVACNAVTQCVAGTDDFGLGGYEAFAYTATTTGTYYLVVDTYNDTNTAPYVLYTTIQ